MIKEITDELLKQYILIAASEWQPKIPEVRACRFCGKKEPEVTFKTFAHIVPELLGVNDSQSYTECDACNSLFSSYETHLAILFRPYLTMVGVQGKKGVPNFQSRTDGGDENTRTQVNYQNEGNRQFIISKADDLKIDWVTGKITMVYRLPPYRPIYVYKALLKIGLSLLPEEMKGDYKQAFSWLVDKSADDLPAFPFAFVTILTRKKMAAPKASLYKAKEVFFERGFNPDLTLIVSFGNVVVQIFLPLPDNFDYARARGLSPELNILPASILNVDSTMFGDAKPTDRVTIKFRFTSIDLSRYETIQHDEKIQFSFDVNSSNSSFL